MNTQRMAADGDQANSTADTGFDKSAGSSNMPAVSAAGQPVLQAILQVMDNAPTPMCLLWGSQYQLFWNDACRSLPQFQWLPAAGGFNAGTLFSKYWPIAEGTLKLVRSGRNLTFSDLELPQELTAGNHKTKFSFSLSPVGREGADAAAILISIAAASYYQPAETFLHDVQAGDTLFKQLVMQSPTAMCILKGEDYRVEIANPPYLEIIERTEASITGLPLFEALPGLEKQGIRQLLDQVMETGKPFYGYEYPLKLAGYSSNSYFNFTFQPLRSPGNAGNITGIILIANDVTKQVLARHRLEESEKQFRTLVLQSPVPMAILRGRDLVVEMANQAMLTQIWHKDFPGIKNRSLTEIFPGFRNQAMAPLLDKVFETGLMQRQNEMKELITAGTGTQTIYLDMMCAPLPEPDGTVGGVIITINDITEKVEARKLIEDAEQRLRLAIEATSLGTFDWNLQTQEFKFSPRLAAIFGFDPADTVNHLTLINAFHPDDKPARDRAVSNAVKKGSLEYDARIVKPDNTISWIKVYGKISYDSNRQPLRMYGTAMDITEEKNVLLALEESESRLNIAISTASLGTYDVDIASSRVVCSERLYKIMDLPAGKAVRREDIMDIIYPQDRIKRNEAHEKALKTGKVEYESRIVWRDNSIHWIKVSSRLLLDEQKKPSRILGTVMDITEQKNYIHQLEESEKRFKMVADTAPVMIWMAGPDKFCYFFNKSWLEFTGRTIEQERGNGWIEGLHPDDYQRCLEIYEDCFNRREQFAMEYRLRMHTGEYHWVSENGVPRFDNNGEFLGYIGGCMDVDGQKRLNDELSKSEARLRIAALSGELGTWDYDPATEELYWDDASGKMFGVDYKVPSSINLFWSVVHPDDDALLTQKVREALDPNIAASFDVEFRAFVDPSTHQYKWINTKGKAFFKDGAPYRFAGTALDITDKKLALEALIKSEERFRLLANAMPQFVWTADNKGMLNYFNQSVFDYTSVPAVDLQQLGWLAIVHADDKDATLERWRKSVSLGEDFFFEHRFKRNDGDYRWQLSRALPQKDADGNIQMWIGTSTDIHDQKLMAGELEKKVRLRTAELMEMNDELSRQKEFVEIIVDSSLILVTAFDVHKNFITFNIKCETVFNRKKEDVIGRPFKEVFPGIELSDTYTHINRALSGETVHISKYKSTVNNRYYESYFVPLTDMEGNIYAALMTSHDITDIVISTEKVQEAYRILEEQNNALERSNRELESFSYVASHDLQEPLRKIQTFIELLHRSLDNREESEKYFDKIRSSAQRMTALIRDVLDYSRLSKQDETFEAVDLNELVKEVIIDFELLIAEKQATINIEQLPLINGIPLQLRQLFTNLVSNSLKFSHKPPVINISCRKILAAQAAAGGLPKADYYHFIFSDNGIGFEQQFAEKIFTIFQRLDTRQYTGTGIGLALCKKIVENHQGLIIAEGNPGKGATFHLYFPF